MSEIPKGICLFSKVPSTVKSKTLAKWQKNGKKVAKKWQKVAFK